MLVSDPILNRSGFDAASFCEGAFSAANDSEATLLIAFIEHGAASGEIRRRGIQILKRRFIFAQFVRERLKT